MITVSVRVHPGTSRDEVAIQEEGVLDVRLRARTVEGKANDALVAVLAERVGLRSRQVTIARGARARHKRLEVDLPSWAALRDILERPA